MTRRDLLGMLSKRPDEVESPKIREFVGISTIWIPKWLLEEVVTSLSEKEVGRLMNAYLRYLYYGEDTHFHLKATRGLFERLKKSADYIIDKYVEG